MSVGRKNRKYGSFSLTEEEKKWSGQVGPLMEGRVEGPEPWAQKTLAGFVPGKHCQAYYDPHDPSKSFILKDYGFSPYGLMLGGLIPLFLGFIFVLVSFDGGSIAHFLVQTPGCI